MSTGRAEMLEDRSVRAGAVAGPTLPIGQVAAATGVPPSTLRLWEQQGLIVSSRTPGGRRRWSQHDVARVLRVKYLRQVERLNAVAVRRTLGEPPAVASEAPSSDYGPSLRALRKQRRLTLRQVALRTGLSRSFISAAERSTTGISLATLERLLGAYGTTVLALMGGDAARAPGSDLAIRSGTGRTFSWDDGRVRIEHLAHGVVQMEPQLFSIAPGGGTEESYTHAGEEFLYVLDGVFEIWLGDDRHARLDPGDSLYFASALPHRWRNPGPSTARLLWVNTPPTF